MKKLLIPMIAILLLLGCGQQQAEQENSQQTSLVPYDFGYRAYLPILTKYVTDGLVDYQGLQADRAGLDSLVAGLARAQLSAATREEKLAFYINAYNMITLRSIIDAYPVKSIKDIDGVWDKKKWSVAGEQVTLNEIEHEILRKEFNEPRIHIAINCASKSCPPLVSQPYYPQNLSDQLELVSRFFATSPTYNSLDPARGVAELSQIFEWFGDDFIPQYYDNGLFSVLCKAENAAVTFVIKHHPAEQQEQLFAADYQISFLEYDWSLNELK